MTKAKLKSILKKAQGINPAIYSVEQCILLNEKGEYKRAFNALIDPFSNYYSCASGRTVNEMYDRITEKTCSECGNLCQAVGKCPVCQKIEQKEV